MKRDDTHNEYNSLRSQIVYIDKGKNNPQDTGVFVYQITNFLEGEQQPRFYKGNVTLIK